MNGRARNILGIRNCVLDLPHDIDDHQDLIESVVAMNSYTYQMEPTDSHGLDGFT